MNDKLNDKFCIHYYNDDTGEGLDAFSRDSEIESLIQPLPKETITEACHEFPAFGERKERRLYAFSHTHGEQLRELVTKFRSKFSYIDGLDNQYAVGKGWVNPAR